MRALVDENGVCTASPCSCLGRHSAPGAPRQVVHLRLRDEQFRLRCTWRIVLIPSQGQGVVINTHFCPQRLPSRHPGR